jgi:hypothetical protein
MLVPTHDDVVHDIAVIEFTHPNARASGN